MGPLAVLHQAVRLRQGRKMALGDALAGGEPDAVEFVIGVAGPLDLSQCPLLTLTMRPA